MIAVWMTLASGLINESCQHVAGPSTIESSALCETENLGGRRVKTEKGMSANAEFRLCWIYSVYKKN